MSNDARLSKADRDAYNEHYASKGLDNAVLAADTLQDDMLGIKRQKEEKYAKAQQKALDAYKAIKEARDREDARFYEEFGMTVDEAKHAFKLSKGELRDLKAKVSPEKDNPAFAQTTTKRVTTRTDGELPETTVTEISTLYDEPEDRKAPHFRVKNEKGEDSYLNYDTPAEYLSEGDDTQTPFESLKSNWDEWSDALTAMSNIIPYGKRDEFLSLDSNGKADALLAQTGMTSDALTKLLKKSDTTRLSDERMKENICSDMKDTSELDTVNGHFGKAHDPSKTFNAIRDRLRDLRY